MLFRISCRILLAGILLMLQVALTQAAGPQALSSQANGGRPEVRVQGRVLNLGEGNFRVLWTMTPTAGWHLYSDRLNDSGFPPRQTMAWPADWLVGELRWPVAERYEMDGGILDHVYHDTITLVQDVIIPQLDESMSLEARWDWLVCKGECVPGKSLVTVEFVPGEEPAANLKAMSGFPVPPPPGAVQIQREGNTATVHVPDAGILEFHPDADGALYRDLLTDGATTGDTLTLHLRPGYDGSTDARGVLKVTTPDGRVEAWLIAF